MFGSSGGNAAYPPAVETFPLSFNDPMFTGMSASVEVNLSVGQDVSNKTFENNTDSVEILAQGNNDITLCRIRSREGIRCDNDETYNIDRCWIETYGLLGGPGPGDDDHADGLQMGGGDTSTLNIRNTTFRSWSDADDGNPERPAAYELFSVGLFYSDGSDGVVTLNNVLFLGGQIAFRFHGDIGTTLNLSLNNVYLVGPFGAFDWEVSEFGGTINIVKWNNVFNATIVNGVLIPGSAIPPP